MLMSTTIQWVQGLLPSRRTTSIEGLTALLPDDGHVIVTPHSDEYMLARMSSIKHHSVRYDSVLTNGRRMFFERRINSQVLEMFMHKPQEGHYSNAAEEIFKMNEYILKNRPHVHIEIRTSSEESSSYRPFLKKAYESRPMINLSMI